MSDQPTVPPESQEPLIPPGVLLGLAVLGFFIALFNGVTQPEFGVVGFGGLGFGLLALVAYFVMSPDALTGRNARFGGLSVIVTLFVLIALGATYWFIQSQEWRVDLSERNEFSLTTEAREKISLLGVDPTLPNLKILAFYDATQAQQRDQQTLLFEDYETVSGGKITYEFIDPNRNPGLLDTYEARTGQLVVVAVNPDGTNDIANAEIVPAADQDTLTSTLLKVSASGVFNAYVMTVTDGITMQPGERGSMNTLLSVLTDSADWNIQDVSFLELAQDESEFTLNDPATDGEVMLIVGGSRPLADAELALVTTFVNNGGSLVLLADNSLNEDRTALATGEALNAYLFENFGMRFRDDLVIDPPQAVQNPVVAFTNDLNPQSEITSILQGANIIYELARTIEIADTLPANVQVTPLLNTSSTAYAKTDFATVLEGDLTQAETDLTGPLVIGAAAENTETGARVVLYGTTALIQDDFAALSGQNIGNLGLSLQSLVWSIRFDEFFTQTNILSAPAIQDQPMFADEQTRRYIFFFTMGVLPFGILLLGLLVWWSNRERVART